MTEKAKALFDYDAQEPNELSFKEGDILIVVEKDESGWWTCRLNGKDGQVPMNFVEVVPGNASTTVSNIMYRGSSSETTTESCNDWWRCWNGGITG